MTTTATFIARFPEFASADVARIQIFLDDAAGMMNPDVWCSKYDVGQAYLAAHYLVKANEESAANGAGGSAAAGPVSGEAVGSVSRSYANVFSTGSGGLTAEDASLLTTSYGQRYVSIRSTLTVTPIVI